MAEKTTHCPKVIWEAAPLARCLQPTKKPEPSDLSEWGKKKKAVFRGRGQQHLAEGMVTNLTKQAGEDFLPFVTSQGKTFSPSCPKLVMHIFHNWKLKNSLYFTSEQ